VKTFPDETIYPGKQNILFNFNEFPAGVYYLSFDNGKEVVVRKVVKVSL
jgi:hypothetical protein